mmetsp:Transcript_2332/g.6976  ORF Transcript_2332/g.6976 Transcript_2332/m.6976 type:complete len:308 (+) Transcript_2332:1145-2068(+)
MQNPPSRPKPRKTPTKHIEMLGRTAARSLLRGRGGGRTVQTRCSSGSPKFSAAGVTGTGFVAGTLGSLAGMGGGFVAIPMMTHFGVSQHAAHGTSLVGVVATGFAGAGAYWLSDSVEPVAALTVASTGMVTAAAGARAAAALEAKVLKRCLGVFMLCVAPVVPFKQHLIDWIQASKKVEEETTTIQKYGALLGTGCCAGFLSGLFGVGGGAVVVPLLAVVTDMDYKTALGTSLLAMVPTGVAGVVAHARLGNVQLPIAAPLVLGTCAGAALGGYLGGNFIPEEPMKLGFGALMTVLGARTLLTTFLK